MNYDLTPLKPLHPESGLITSKLIVFGRQSTDTILASLLPGQTCWRVRHVRAAQIGWTVKSGTSKLSSGKNVVIHRLWAKDVPSDCGVPACLAWIHLDSAAYELEKVRGTAVPETAEQRRWIDLVASSLTRTR